MTGNHIEIWNKCLSVIKDNTEAQSFETWFEPIVPIALVDSVLTIQVPNEFFYEYLENHYIDLLKKTIKRVIGLDGKLVYSIVMDSGDSSATMKLPSSNRTDPRNQLSRPAPEKLSEVPMNPFVIPGLKKLVIDPQLNENYTFDNFIEGECNRVARQGGMEIAKNPGKTAYNPLLIYSNTGLGKTHLCHAIGLETKRLHPEATVLYVQAEQFTNQYITASKNKNLNDFVHFYQMIDVLIIDDIQFLAKKPMTQETFFHIFNYLHQNNKQLIITSDKMPSELQDMEARLLSRFKWGLTTELQMPDIPTRLAILQNKLYTNGIVLSDEVVDYLASNVRTNVRELEGIMISLVAQSVLNKKTITLDLTRQIIDRFIHNSVKEVSVEYIINLVCEYYGISFDQLVSNSRKQQVVLARQVAMFLSKKYSSASLTSIGMQCGKKDHATVSHACKTISDRLETDKQFKVKLADIEKKILS